MNHLPLIIKREYLNKVKNKAFLIMTILSPLIFIALIAVVAYLSQLNNDSQRQISVLDESGYLTGVFKDSESIKYHQNGRFLMILEYKRIFCDDWFSRYTSFGFWPFGHKCSRPIRSLHFLNLNIS